MCASVSVCVCVYVSVSVCECECVCVPVTLPVRLNIIITDAQTFNSATTIEKTLAMVNIPKNTAVTVAAVC